MELSLPTVWMACRRECLCFGGDRDEGEAHDVFAVFGVAAIQLRSALAGPALEKIGTTETCNWDSASILVDSITLLECCSSNEMVM